jgi:hypothetical protein
MSHRPDSDDVQDCASWAPGRPGDGVLAIDLTRWRPPEHYRVDERGGPARDARQGSGTHRFTAAEDVPLLRAHDALRPCYGDGHYECRRCIFVRDGEAR